jgi:hypothetical protein
MKRLFALLFSGLVASTAALAGEPKTAAPLSPPAATPATPAAGAPTGDTTAKPKKHHKKYHHSAAKSEADKMRDRKSEMGSMGDAKPVAKSDEMKMAPAADAKK